MLGRVMRSWWLRLGITAAILLYLESRIDMAAAARAVLTVSRPHLVAVLALVALDRSVMILRWVLLLRASGTPIATRSAAWIFLVSSFVGSFLPAGVGGDAARAWTLTQRTAQGSEALASVAVDRLLGILSLVAMGIAGLVMVAPAGEADWRVPAAVLILAAICLGAFWADRLVRAVVPAHWHDGPVSRRLLKLSDAVSRYRGRGGVLAHVMAWSIVVQVLRIGQAYLIGLGLGITVPFRYYLLFMPIGLLMLLLPVSVSGFGLPQGVFVWLLRPLGVADERSFALSTLIVLTGLAGNLPGLVLWLRSRR
ncbi:MAG: lysylphosphatidylglycerol synthase transmembrane domain-containing protein [Vicinamibacterales bacterium]